MSTIYNNPYKRMLTLTLIDGAYAHGSIYYDATLCDEDGRRAECLDPVR
jgi:hypothetical protein